MRQTTAGSGNIGFGPTSQTPSYADGAEEILVAEVGMHHVWVLENDLTDLWTFELAGQDVLVSDLDGDGFEIVQYGDGR